MKTLTHLLPLVGLLAVGVAGLVVLGPEPPGCPYRPGSIREQLAPRDELECRRIVALNHVEARIRVARAVIAKQLTPLQGAEHLLDLHKVNPYFDWEQFRTVYEGESDMERCRRQLQDTIRSETAIQKITAAQE